MIADLAYHDPSGALRVGAYGLCKPPYELAPSVLIPRDPRTVARAFPVEVSFKGSSARAFRDRDNMAPWRNLPLRVGTRDHDN